MSPGAQRLRARREAVVRYLLTLLNDFDATTKADILHGFLFDLQIRASKKAMERAKEAGLDVEYDTRAAFGILSTMRLLASAYSDIAKEGNEALAGELPIYAAELVKALNQIVREKPELGSG